MKTWRQLLLFSASLSLLSTPLLFAQSSSNNYEINEYFLGPGGDLDLNSASFNARATLGDLGSGNFSSTNYQLYAGFTTTEDPYIELVVNQATIDMGVLDDSTTGTGNATFSVRTYLAEGYVIHTGGGLPTSESGATIDAMTSPAMSTQGIEQFGMNLAANTDPIVFGAIPTQGYNGQGVVTTNYDDDGFFKYDEGEAVASSASSTGITNYTASYIMNVSPITEAGFYQTAQSFIVTSTY